MYLSGPMLQNIMKYGPAHIANFVGCSAEDIEFEFTGIHADLDLVIEGKVRFKKPNDINWRKASRIVCPADSKGWHMFGAKVDKETLKVVL